MKQTTITLVGNDPMEPRRHLFFFCFFVKRFGCCCGITAQYSNYVELVRTSFLSIAEIKTIPAPVKIKLTQHSALNKDTSLHAVRLLLHVTLVWHSAQELNI